VYVAYTAGSSEFLGKPAIFRVGDSKGKVLSGQKGHRVTAKTPYGARGATTIRVRN
jgi:hypothetical protein